MFAKFFKKPVDLDLLFGDITEIGKACLVNHIRNACMYERILEHLGVSKEELSRISDNACNEVARLFEHVKTDEDLAELLMLDMEGKLW